MLQLPIPTPAMPEDRKGQLAALPHPTAFQLTDAAFDELTERVAGYVTAEPNQYWTHLCHDSTTIQQQQKAREDTKELPKSARSPDAAHCLPCDCVEAGTDEYRFCMSSVLRCVCLCAVLRRVATTSLDRSCSTRWRRWRQCWRG